MTPKGKTLKWFKFNVIPLVIDLITEDNESVRSLHLFSINRRRFLSCLKKHIEIMKLDLILIQNPIKKSCIFFNSLLFCNNTKNLCFGYVSILSE